jgi:hypothetical protein
MSSKAIVILEMISFFLLVGAYFFVSIKFKNCSKGKLIGVALLYLITLSFSFFKRIDTIIYLLTAFVIIIFNLKQQKGNERRNKRFGG